MSQDATASPEHRATELLRAMTVEEKAQQVAGVMPVGLDGLLQDVAERALGLGIGHLAALGMLGHKTPDPVAKAVNEIQRFLVTRTRLGIPAIFHVEALNGVVSPGFTTFPTAIGGWLRPGTRTGSRRWQESRAGRFGRLAIRSRSPR